MNKPTISPFAKKRFINWFLDNWEFRGKTPQKVLLSILEQDSTLNTIKIIENGSFLRPLLVVSSLGTGMPSCLLLTYETVLTKTESILDYLSTLNSGNLYLTLYFPGRNSCLPFFDVIEEIPLPLDEQKIKSLQLDLEIQLLLAEGEIEDKRNKIMAEIDLALAKREKDEFLRLARMLKNL